VRYISSSCTGFNERTELDSLKSYREATHHSSQQSDTINLPSSSPSLSQSQLQSQSQPKPTLILHENEEKLFEWLKQVIIEKELNTTVRVAGGWVRDRLLGLPGKDDIDIALDNMTGLEFVSILNSWNEEHGMNKVKFGIIQQNPDKSKHLETG
jgi:hypothetical protein